MIFVFIVDGLTSNLPCCLLNCFLIHFINLDRFTIVKILHIIYISNMSIKKQNKGLQAAIKKAGGQICLAKSLTVSQSAISFFLNKRLPDKRAHQIHTMYNVPLSDLIIDDGLE